VAWKTLTPSYLFMKSDDEGVGYML